MIESSYATSLPHKYFKNKHKATHMIFQPQVLIVHLLYELSKGQTSQWEPYLQQLPADYSTFAYFGEQHTSELQVSLPAPHSPDSTTVKLLCYA